MKRALIILLVTTLAALTLGLAAAGCGEEGAEVYKIGITQIATNVDLDKSNESFVNKMTELGYIEGENVTYERNNPEGDMNLAASIAKKYVDEKVDLICAITTPCAQACAAAAEGTDIPIVFANVTDPVKAGLVSSWENGSGNITGVSDWTDIAIQMQLIMQIMPNLKTLGLLYNAGETNSVVQVELVKEAAKQLGFSTVEATAATTADVNTAITSLLGRCDATWFPTDNVMGASVEVLVKTSEEQKLPLFGSSLGHVEQGAIASEGVNEQTEGAQAAIFADQILKGEKKPGEIPIYKFPTNEIYVNLGAAERMGITIPQEIIDKALVKVQ